MADIAINFSLSLVEQIINFTINVQEDQVDVAGSDISQVKAHLKAMQTIVQSRGGTFPAINEAFVEWLRPVAYDIEEVLDDIMLNEPHYSPQYKVVKKTYHLIHNTRLHYSFNTIRDKIKTIRQQLKVISENLSIQFGHGEDPRTNIRHHLPQPVPDCEILGIHVLKEKLISQLINNEASDWSEIMVVGPPGSGKTALINSVYNDQRVIMRFGTILSASLSPRFEPDSVFSYLKSQVSHCCATGDLANDLRKRLEGKRYLVLLDDVRSEKDWRDLKRAFPDDPCGSRLVIATTKMDVVTSSSIAAVSSHIHLVDGLKEEESWRLFCKKAFRRESGACPRDLVDLCGKIVHKCEGSPLAISAVASLFMEKPRLESDWTRVWDSIISEMERNHLFTDLNNSILQSYHDLDSNLKSCLLYFSLFPEGSCVQRSSLIRLWVAERFANESGGKPAEEVAEEYLNELIRRHLVVAERALDDRVNKCRVRNFLHYFLTIKSRKEDFAVMLNNSSSKPRENVRRISVADANVSQLKRLCTFITLVASPSQIASLRNPFMSKYLKVLDFRCSPLLYFPDCVLNLGLLRHLSLRGSVCISQVPSSIKKLRYLEFLDLKYTSVTCLPKEICSLHNLRHLLVYNYRRALYNAFDPAQGMRMKGEIGGLSSIQKLTLLKAETYPKFFHQLGCLTQLQKLGLIELRSSDGRLLCESLAKMKRLSVLDLRSLNKSEFLDLDYPQLPCNMLQRVYLKGRLTKLPRWIRSLRSLVRIHLRWSRLETSPISDLQGLSNLIEMQLSDAFVGDVMKFGRDAFRSLKVLQVEEFAELSKVEAFHGSLSKLEKLTLCNCGRLKTLPLYIQRLPELKELVLIDMPVELRNSLAMDQSKIKVHSSKDVGQE